MYSLEIKEEVDKIFKKLSKKNLKQLEIINQKNNGAPRPLGHGLKQPLVFRMSEN